MRRVALVGIHHGDAARRQQNGVRLKVRYRIRQFNDFSVNKDLEICYDADPGTPTEGVWGERGHLTFPSPAPGPDDLRLIPLGLGIFDDHAAVDHRGVPY